MNTVNAAGYLVGALLAPRALRRLDARTLMLGGGAIAALLLPVHGAVRGDAMLYLLRGLTGVASAASFVGGGLLAARLAGAGGMRPGLVLGIYYGGVGIGIVASAALVPALVGAAPPLAAPGAASSQWPAAWFALGAVALASTAFTAIFTRGLGVAPLAATLQRPFAWRRFGPALAGYTMFGLGYIGYMTFVVTLLREQGLAGAQVSAFYALLGAGVMASPWLWAGLLQRWHGGGPLALLNALLALATLLPVLSANTTVAFASGLLFGAVFLSLVASTTALVRHNCEAAAWPAGIAAFTVVFAAGQIVGPSVVGVIADGPGGLQRGFLLSAAVLALGALLAAAQRPLSVATARS
jgi:predicted MFS family arabinose efflux permease